jgi:hypothetical protein
VRAHRAVFQSLREGMTQSQVSGLEREAHRSWDGRARSSSSEPTPPSRTERPGRSRSAAAMSCSSTAGAAPRLRERHHAHGRLRRAAHRAAAQVWDVVRRRRRRPSSRQPGSRPGRGRRGAQGVEEAASAPTTSTSPTASATASAWTATSGPTSCAATPRSSGPGMCFSDEPGIYIPARWGSATRTHLHHGDGRENMTKWTGSPEEPAIV